MLKRQSIVFFNIITTSQKAELLWSRHVNTRRLVGCNIPCDLRMEHLNRRLKMVLKTQGANIHPESVEIIMPWNCATCV